MGIIYDKEANANYAVIDFDAGQGNMAVKLPVTYNIRGGRLGVQDLFTAREVIEWFYGLDSIPCIRRFLSIEYEDIVRKWPEANGSRGFELKGYTFVGTECDCFQPLGRTIVDLLYDGKVDPHCDGENGIRTFRFRLRYIMDFEAYKHPCIGPLIFIEEQTDAFPGTEKEYKSDKYGLPLLSREDLDDLATKILNKYFPQCDLDDVPDIERLAKKMGLMVRRLRLRSKNIMGCLHYEYAVKGTEDRYGEFFEYDAEANTVVLNEHVCRTIEDETETLAHECSHRLLTTTFYMLQICAGRSALACACRNVNTMRDDENPLQIAEKQCDEMMKCLLLEKNRLRAFLKKQIREKQMRRPWDNSEMSYMLEKTAEHFHVSKKVARERFVDLGLTEFENFQLYRHGLLIPQYRSEGEYVYKVPNDSWYAVTCAHPTIFELLVEQKFVYTENCFCKNTSDYVYYDHKSRARLTEYAKTHPEECCLRFRVRGGSKATYQYGAAAKNTDVPNIFSSAYEWTGEYGTQQYQNENKSYVDNCGDLYDIVEKLKGPLGADLRVIMKQKKMTQEKLADKLCIEKGTLSKYLNGELGMDREMLLAIIIAIGMRKFIADIILENAGIRLNPRVKEDIVYIKLLEDHERIQDKQRYDDIMHAMNFDLSNRKTIRIRAGSR